jgi:hypothetical protein
MDKKKLEEICAEAVRIESGISVAEVRSYEKKIKQKSYEPIYDIDST